MSNRQKRGWDTYTLTAIGVLAAAVYVVTLFRFPLLGSKVHFANALCLLSGLLLPPLPGGLAAGLGSGLYDVLNGYDPAEALITFASKFAMAFVCSLIAGVGKREQPDMKRVLLGVVTGALTYVALYMLKTFIYQHFIYAYPLDAVWATMLSKLIPSLINAGLSIVAAPIFFRAVWPAVKHILLGEQKRT